MLLILTYVEYNVFKFLKSFSRAIEF